MGLAGTCFVFSWRHGSESNRRIKVLQTLQTGSYGEPYGGLSDSFSDFPRWPRLNLRKLRLRKWHSSELPKHSHPAVVWPLRSASWPRIEWLRPDPRNSTA